MKVCSKCVPSTMYVDAAFTLPFHINKMWCGDAANIKFQLLVIIHGDEAKASNCATILDKKHSSFPTAGALPTLHF